MRQFWNILQFVGAGTPGVPYAILPTFLLKNALMCNECRKKMCNECRQKKCSETLLKLPLAGYMSGYPRNGFTVPLALLIRASSH